MVELPTPIDLNKAIMAGIGETLREVMLSPRTHCVPHKKPKTGFKSADLVLYAHDRTELELRLHTQEGGAYVITAADNHISQHCKEYIEAFFRGYSETPADEKWQYLSKFGNCKYSLATSIPTPPQD
jgi:hypothetical protein|uniref:Uncharacterized protein n=1 Tax=Myoviridae sp. ctshb19 TaxID=2825194 RepID=A0A8S5UG85_9CAUD|nr:MAG TPA: hypothetical protein [Myoviridae sp. ctshb19]